VGGGVVLAIAPRLTRGSQLISAFGFAAANGKARSDVGKRFHTGKSDHRINDLLGTRTAVGALTLFAKTCLMTLPLTLQTRDLRASVEKK
jgi:hypothetical protein